MRVARRKLLFGPTDFRRLANPDAEGVMTDATAGAGSHQGSVFTSYVSLCVAAVSACVQLALYAVAPDRALRHSGCTQQTLEGESP